MGLHFENPNIKVSNLFCDKLSFTIDYALSSEHQHIKNSVASAGKLAVPYRRRPYRNGALIYEGEYPSQMTMALQWQPIHSGVSFFRADSFRNPNGVYMKLMNFRRFDPEYTSAGKKGLTRGAKGEEEVWAEFAKDPARCQATAEAIIAALDDPEVGGPENDLTDIEEAPEGRLITRKHLARERSRKLVEAKRKQALKKLGKLECEVCKFDFAKMYGLHGTGFIECHHTKPVTTLTEGHKTHIDELALVCANCHRMIHRTKPWLTMDGLRALLNFPV